MHIPDGFLSHGIEGATFVVSAGACAYTLADRVIVCSMGRIVQAGHPEEILHLPRTSGSQASWEAVPTSSPSFPSVRVLSGTNLAAEGLCETPDRRPRLPANPPKTGDDA
jgi:ABC-type dipeptide/oligopeptide/nickel transport system ATPase component